jgi:MFS family permease
VGGALIASSGWRSIFWLVLPFAAASGVLGAIGVVERREELRRRQDLPGQVLAMLALLGISSGLIEGPRRGLPLGAALVGMGVAAGAAFLRREARTASPMMPLELFRVPAFSAAVGGAALTEVGLALFTGPISNAAVSNAPADRAGAASGLVNGARMVGATVSVALMGIFFADGTSGGPAAVAGATRAALALAAGSEALGAVVAVLWLGSSARSRPGPGEAPERATA